MKTEPAPLFRFGVVADAQYADRDEKYGRFFRRSLAKLRDAVAAFNEAGVDFVVDLGDIMDGGIENLGPALETYAPLSAPVYRVLGNHDLAVQESELQWVVRRLGLERPYYAFTFRSWRFIVLDGTDVSTYAHPRGSREHGFAAEVLQKLRDDGRANAREWNGGIGETQLDWLRRKLADPANNTKNTIVLCHLPVFPVENRHALWNAEDVLRVLDGAPAVRAVLAGHKHEGEYAMRRGVHHMTFAGMVETEDSSAYAIVDVHPAFLRVRGHGREPQRIVRLP